jgi:poly-gamma-glutamate synthesis protein (capsule biosynthesis protein)
MRHLALWTVAVLAPILVMGAGAVAPAWAQDKTISLTLVGQSMIRSDLRVTAPQEVPVIRSLLTGDVRFTNFESTVALEGQTVPGGGGRGFLTPPAALDSLGSFGFNLLSLSNNHAFDLGPSGIANTLDQVAKSNVVHAGIGKTLEDAAAPAYLKTDKGTVALVASASGLMVPGARATATTPGVNELRIHAGDKLNEANAELPAGPNTIDAEDSARILKNIREARAHADLVVVYQHNHVFTNRPFSAVFGEGLPERLVPPGWLKAWVHAEIDAGADVVVMHGAPLLHGIEIYKGKPIFYDLGSFIYNLPPAITYIEEPINWETAVAYVDFSGRTLKSITLKPIALNTIGQGQPDVHNQYTSNEFLVTRGLPSLATGMQANDILERVANASKPFGTKLVIKDGVATVSLGK